jgi:hypothetical protein
MMIDGFHTFGHTMLDFLLFKAFPQRFVRSEVEVPLHRRRETRRHFLTGI